MKYDDASWHYGGEFPKDLPASAGATHIALFVTWCVLNGLVGEIHLESQPEELERLRAREVTPTDWFIRMCDEKFTDEDLSDEGNAFAIAYYQSTVPGSFLDDYEGAFGLPQVYAVPPTWESYDKIAPILATRLGRWRAESYSAPSGRDATPSSNAPRRKWWWPF